jgi:hypothetical protein
VPGFTAAGQGVTFVDPYLSKRAPYYENFNFGVQQELTKGLVLSLDYAGSNGRFLPTGEGNGVNSDQLNPIYDTQLGSLLSAKATPANIAAVQKIIPTFNPAYTIGQSLRPFPQYSGVTDIYGDFGMSSYNSLQAVLVQKAQHGLSYTFNYTLSKLFDNTGTGRTAYDHSYERSLGLYDHRNNISAYAVYAEPFGKGHRFVDKLIKDYETSAIFTATSGTPLAIVGSGCVTVSSGTCEPNLTPGFVGPVRLNGDWGRGSTAAALSSTPYISSAAFSTPTAYTFGNASRTAPYGLIGPGNYNINMTLRRYFGLHEGLKLMLEIDGFNITNHTNFSNPATTLGSSSFGTITSASGASRDLQLVGRVDF